MNSELDFSKHHCTNTSLFWMGLCGWVRKKTVQFSNFHQNFQFHLELSGWICLAITKEACLVSGLILCCVFFVAHHGTDIIRILGVSHHSTNNYK